jgi:hypothetical protein
LCAGHKKSADIFYQRFFYVINHFKLSLNLPSLRLASSTSLNLFNPFNLFNPPAFGWQA